MRALLLACALTLAAGAANAHSSSLTLAEPREGETRAIVDGASWRCQGANCSATGGKSQPALRACKRVVAKIGRAETYSHRGQALTADQVADCNTAAAR